MKWGQETEREKVGDKNVIDTTETENRNNIREEITKEKKRFLDLNKFPALSWKGLMCVKKDVFEVNL